MPQFKIKALIQGLETIIEVHHLVPWNANEFRIRFFWGIEEQCLRLKFDRGHWKFIPGVYVYQINLEDLEIDTIGHKIISFLCIQLSERLDHFQLYI